MIKKLDFEKCNGLDNISNIHSGEPPTLTNGLRVVLRKNGVKLYVEIRQTVNNRGEIIEIDPNKIYGEVVKIEEASESLIGIDVDDIVQFASENICYIAHDQQGVSSQ